MKAALSLLEELRRPRLLISAARFGLADYDRSRDLKRILRAGPPPSPAKAVEHLMQEEETLEQTRKSGSGAYSVARHVDVLIALMAEAHILRST